MSRRPPEYRDYNPDDVWESDRLQALDAAYEENESALTTIANLENMFKALEWYDVAVETFGADVVALYEAQKLREEDDDSLVNNLL